MPALYPADVVAPGEVVADEAGIGVVAEVEKSVDADLLNRVCGRLKRDIRAQVPNAGYSGRRTTGAVFAGVTEAKIIQQGRPENMVFVNQVVLVGDVGAVSVGQKIRGVENRSPLELIVAVAHGEPVVLRKGVVNPAQILLEILVVRLQVGHRLIRTQRQACQNVQGNRIDGAGGAARPTGIQVGLNITRRTR